MERNHSTNSVQGLKMKSYEKRIRLLNLFLPDYRHLMTFSILNTSRHPIGLSVPTRTLGGTPINCRPNTAERTVNPPSTP